MYMIIVAPADDALVFRGGIGGRVDGAFDSCLKHTYSNPAEAGHCMATVG